MCLADCDRLGIDSIARLRVPELDLGSTTDYVRRHPGRRLCGSAALGAHCGHAWRQWPSLSGSTGQLHNEIFWLKVAVTAVWLSGGA